MNLTAIPKIIIENIPAIQCEPGCVDCCTVALWTKQEWDCLPAESKTGIGSINVPMRGPGRARLKTILPVKESQIIPLAMKKKLAVTEVTRDSLLLTSVGLENIRCPFAVDGEGCTVYDYRPFVCRIMGSGEKGRMHCPKDIEPASYLPDDIIMQRFLLWTNLFEKSGD